MDVSRIDRLVSFLAQSPSRRGFLRGLVATLPLLAPHVSDPVEARKQRKKKPTLTFNEFGCVAVGGTCGGNGANCCSGICQGKKPRKGQQDRSTCIVHNVGECQAGQDACLEFTRLCGTNGICFRTTGKASFCGLGGTCAVCANGEDCETQAGPGAACVVCAVDCVETGGTACIAPAT